MSAPARRPLGCWWCSLVACPSNSLCCGSTKEDSWWDMANISASNERGSLRKPPWLGRSRLRCTKEASHLDSGIGRMPSSPSSNASDRMPPCSRCAPLGRSAALPKIATAPGSSAPPRPASISGGRGPWSPARPRSWPLCASSATCDAMAAGVG